MPEKIEDNSWKNSSLRRRNSDPVCYVTTDEDADVGFMKLYEDTLQDLLQKVRKEDKTTNDLQGFLNHQQNYVDKLLKEIKHLKEEKQKMSFELFAAKMEVEILKKQQLCIYEPGYITGLVQELQKASSERADILSSYCDKVQSLAYQKSQPFVPYNNQNYQSTFRPYQNGYQNYNNAYTTGPYTNMNGAQPPRDAFQFTVEQPFTGFQQFRPQPPSNISSTFQRGPFIRLPPGISQPRHERVSSITRYGNPANAMSGPSSFSEWPKLGKPLYSAAARSLETENGIGTESNVSSA
ncbi:hypothetical protein QYM36_015298 [Artemia franciscana]|uniref:Uncharacterized protein n=1 Tax=Artemia franciscana TaxID=6661 RepID=A0AA88HHF7_ARTSF|nr:hypothetical protein QYM36_015298 [Artemia franciscana]